MRERENRRNMYKLVFTALTLVFMISAGISTSVTYTDVPKSSDKQVVTPGEDSVRVSAFTVQDGGDTVISGGLDEGDGLYGFEANRTVFLNQTDSSVSGVNGFDGGEDVFRVSVLHNSGVTEVFSNEAVGNFSSDVFFADGGNRSDGVFNGDNGVGNVSEAVVLDNTSAGTDSLDSHDYIVSSGRMNVSNFSEDVQFVDVNGDGMYDPSSEALVRNSSNSLKSLDDGDRVLVEQAADLQQFSSNVSFADVDGDGNFEEGNAVLAESPTSNSRYDTEDTVLMNGSFDNLSAANTRISYYNSTSGFFQNSGEPIYHEPVTNPDLAVNESDIRVGEVEIDVPQGLRVLYNNSWHDSSLEIGKSLYNVTAGNTGYGGNGTFLVYEYANTGSADGVWNPGDSTDQEVLFYDVDGSITGGTSMAEVYVYDSNTSRTTIPNDIEVGERFNSSQASAVSSPDTSYNPEVNVTFDGSDSTYQAFTDNVTLNISQGGNSRVVILGPEPNASDLGYEGTLHNGGFVRFWNATTGSNSDSEMDGIFVDMDRDGQATTGDLRLGGWKKINPAGAVSDGSVDIGINLTEFRGSDGVQVINNDHDSLYEPGSGSEGSREAIVLSQDSLLESTDEIVRTGLMDLGSFDNRNPERRFVDADGDSIFDGFEAIVKNDGLVASILEDSDTVIEPGNASLTNISDQTRFVENGSAEGFEVGSPEAIVRDDGADGVFETGYLNQSPDEVLRAGEANLMAPAQPPNSTGETGLVYVDSNDTGRYSTGEDILRATFIRNGSASEKINGTEILNFADSTKHNDSTGYSRNDSVVNDTDMNGVFEDVFEGIEIENRMDKASKNPSFLRNVSSNEIDGGDLVIYRDLDSDAEFDDSDVKVSDIQYQGSAKPYTWNTSSFSEQIASDTSYLVVFNSSTSLGSDLAYGFKANVTGLTSQGAEVLDSQVNSNKQVIDDHAPEITGVWTGNTSAGNSPAASRDRLYVETNEQYRGLNNATLDSQDFSVYGPGSTPLPEYTVSDVIDRDYNNFIIELDGSFNTGMKFSIQLDGTFSDNADNSRSYDNSPDSYTVMDGIRPRVLDVVYRDEAVNGSVDLLDVVFSENISEYSYEAGDWTVESRNLSGLQVEAARNRSGNILPLNASAEAGITGVKDLSDEPRINYSNLGTQISDGDGNYLANISDFRMSDGAGPLIWNGTTKDEDNDAKPDRLVLNFTEQVYDNVSALENSSFRVVNPSTGRVESVGSANSNTSVLSVNISDLGDTSVNPTLRMLNYTIFDRHGNAAGQNQDFSTFVENSNPVLVGASISEINSTRNNTFVELEFSEPVLDSEDTSDVEIENKSFNFSISSENSTRLIEYGEVLDTSTEPLVTNITGIIDDSGNDAALFENNNVTVNTVRREIEQGWNFVSLPIADESEPQISSVLNTSQINVVWTYYKGEWRTYDPEAAVNDFNSFDGGRGYLINASDSFMLEANVDNVDRTDGNFFKKSVQVGNGWNLIGHFQEYRQAPSYDEALDSLGNSGIGPVLGHQEKGAPLQDYKVFRDFDNDTLRDLRPGNAYWMLKEDSDSETYTFDFIGG